MSSKIPLSLRPDADVEKGTVRESVHFKAPPITAGGSVSGTKRVVYAPGLRVTVATRWSSSGARWTLSWWRKTQLNIAFSWKTKLGIQGKYRENLGQETVAATRYRRATAP